MNEVHELFITLFDDERFFKLIIARNYKMKMNFIFVFNIFFKQITTREVKFKGENGISLKKFVGYNFFTLQEPKQ